MSKTNKRGKTYKPRRKVARKRTAPKRGPKNDYIVTRDFKFIAKTAQTSSVHDCLLSNAKLTFVGNRILLDVQLIPGLANWATVYQEFRIDTVRVSLPGLLELAIFGGVDA
jgi:hypothetical protein